jgi:hypothetical protein
MSGMDDLRPPDVTPLTPEQAAARGKRNIMLALLLAALMVLIFVISLTQLKAGLFQRPM